jgi:hypothetical protein
MSQLNIDILRLNMKQQNANAYLTVFGNDNNAAGGFYYNGTAGLWVTSLDNATEQTYQNPVILGPSGAPIDATTTNPIKIVKGTTTVTATTASGALFIGNATVTLVGNAIFTASADYFVLASVQIGGGTNAVVQVYPFVTGASTFTLSCVSSVSANLGVNWLAVGY